MKHLHITLNDDIYLLDCATEIAHARAHMADAGIVSLPTYLGGPDDDSEATGYLLFAAGWPTPCPLCKVVAQPIDALADGTCHDCADGETPAAADLPTDRSLAEMLMTLVDPASDEDMRAEVTEQLGNMGRVDVESFREGGVLTRNEGFTIRIGSATYQVTVVS